MAATKYPAKVLVVYVNADTEQEIEEDFDTLEEAKAYVNTYPAWSEDEAIVIYSILEDTVEV